MSYSQEWLEDQSAIRGVLVEVGVLSLKTNQEITLYLSNIGYITEDSLVSFNPVITGGIQITESISLDSTTSLSFGDLQVSNYNGEYDSWLDDSLFVWVNRPIKIYIGDPSWVCTNLAQVRTDFGLVFSGVVTDIDSSSRDSLNIRIGDKLQRLNTPLSEDKLGVYGTWPGDQSNQDTVKPLVFGEPFNISPLLINPAQLEYMFNNGATERVIEIRDNGVPIYNSSITSNVIVNTTLGTFKLLKPLIGTCTVSLQGKLGSINLVTGVLSSTYTNTIANAIALICTQYGNNSTKLAISEIDLNNFAAFNIANSQAIGIYISDRENVLNICQSIASSLNAQLYMTRLGKLQLLQLGVYTSDATVVITNDDILQHTLGISTRTPVIAASKLGYCKNWTVQPNLTTNIPTEHKDIMKTEWYTSTVVDPEVKLMYSLNSDPIQKETVFIDRLESDTEAVRLLNYFSVPRTIYRLTGTSKLLSLKLGQAVTLVHDRFNLANGKTGQVVTLTPNWATSTVELEVLI